MGKLTVKFEAENQEELFADIAQFCGPLIDAAVIGAVAPSEPPKPKTRGRKSKKDKEAEEAAKTPATAVIDLGAGPAELPAVTHPQLVEALTALQVAKGDDMIIQVMEEFGGSVKMMEIPEENYALLFSEVIKATNG